MPPRDIPILIATVWSVPKRRDEANHDVAMNDEVDRGITFPLPAGGR